MIRRITRSIYLLLDGKDKLVSEKIDRNEIEELLYAIQNIAHAEYHYIELLEINSDLIKYNGDEVEDGRMDAVKELREARTELMEVLATIRPATNPLWCVLKHLLMGHLHLMELIERKPSKRVLDLGRRTWVLIDQLLDSYSEFKDFKHCKRCDDDAKRET